MDDLKAQRKSVEAYFKGHSFKKEMLRQPRDVTRDVAELHSQTDPRWQDSRLSDLVVTRVRFRSLYDHFEAYFTDPTAFVSQEISLTNCKEEITPEPSH